MSESDTSIDAGWNRYFVKSAGGLQRDLAVHRDESLTDLVFTVTGETPDGAAVASMKKNSIINKKHMEVTLADGTEWTVVRIGRLKQLCTVLDDDVPVVRADLTTLALQHRYPIEIADGVDVPLAVGLVWAINFAHLQRVSGAGAAAAT